MSKYFLQIRISYVFKFPCNGIIIRPLISWSTYLVNVQMIIFHCKWKPFLVRMGLRAHPSLHKQPSPNSVSLVDVINFLCYFSTATHFSVNALFLMSYLFFVSLYLWFRKQNIVGLQMTHLCVDLQTILIRAWKDKVISMRPTGTNFSESLLFHGFPFSSIPNSCWYISGLWACWRLGC